MRKPTTLDDWNTIFHQALEFNTTFRIPWDDEKQAKAGMLHAQKSLSRLKAKKPLLKSIWLRREDRYILVNANHEHVEVEVLINGKFQGVSLAED